MKVDTDELHGAAQTLARVDSALVQRSDLDVGARDLGSQQLATAVADLCQKAGNLATLFSASIGAAAATTHGAAERHSGLTGSGGSEKVSGSLSHHESQRVRVGRQMTLDLNDPENRHRVQSSERLGPRGRARAT